MIRSIVTFAIFLILSGAIGYENDEKYDISDLKPFLERFKTVMKNGNESLKIPVFDPLNVKQEFFHIVLSYITADLNLTNLYMIGLSDYQVKEGKFQLIGLNMKLAFRWDKLFLKSEYDVNGIGANKYPIYGNGKFMATLKGLDVTCNLYMGLRGNKLYVTGVSSTIDLESLDFQATGLYNDEKRSEELSRKISERGPGVLRKYPSQAGVILSEIVEKVVTIIIHDKTIKELLDLIRI